MRKATDQRDAQTISLLWTSILLFHGGDVTCFDVMKLLAGRDEVMWVVVRWRGEYYWLVAMCHVMSCRVIWCDVIACVVPCHVMQCRVMVMSCYLLCPAMGWNAMSLRCHWLWAHVAWLEVVLWRCGDPKFYSWLQSTTMYYSSNTPCYNLLLLYFSVLQRTTTYYSSTTLYYCSTAVLLDTTRY